MGHTSSSSTSPENLVTSNPITIKLNQQHKTPNEQNFYTKTKRVLPKAYVNLKLITKYIRVVFMNTVVNTNTNLK